ncbi:hypothetical protein pb186bvf_020516 [Paramecium bursaria]
MNSIIWLNCKIISQACNVFLNLHIILKQTFIIKLIRSLGIQFYSLTMYYQASLHLCSRFKVIGFIGIQLYCLVPHFDSFIISIQITQDLPIYLIQTNICCYNKYHLQDSIIWLVIYLHSFFISIQIIQSVSYDLLGTFIVKIFCLIAHNQQLYSIFQS